MADQPDIFTWFTSEPGRAATAGALGGLVRWLTLRSNWREGVPTLVVGAICANYLGPIALSIIETWLGHPLAPESTLDNLMPFLTGVGGMTLSGIVLDIFEKRRSALKGGQ